MLECTEAMSFSEPLVLSRFSCSMGQHLITVLVVSSGKVRPDPLGLSNMPTQSFILSLHINLHEFIHSSMHSVTSRHTFLVCLFSDFAIGLLGIGMEKFHPRCVDWSHIFHFHSLIMLYIT